MAFSMITPCVQKHDKQTLDPFYSTANQMHLIKSIKELRNGQGTVHELIEDDESKPTSATASDRSC